MCARNKRAGGELKAPLPVMEGVGPSRQRLPAGDWKTVLEFLKEHYKQVEESTWLDRMERGLVVDETGLRLNPLSPYRAGGFIYYYREAGHETRVPFEERVLYRDEHILVADKPHFLPVIPSGPFLRETLLVRLKHRFGLEELTPMHRIDRQTAGIVLFSVNPATRGAYASLFRRREVKKLYEALAPALTDADFPMTRRSRIVRGEPFFRMKEVEGEPNSETHIEVKGSVCGPTLYELRPVTGRKHQLRLHLSGLGIPILNDRLYPEVWPPSEDDYARPLKLLAKSVSFNDPLTGREHFFESGRNL